MAIAFRIILRAWRARHIPCSIDAASSSVRSFASTRGVLLRGGGTSTPALIAAARLLGVGSNSSLPISIGLFQLTAPVFLLL